MLVASRLYSARELAELVRCTLTQLGYLQQIGLLAPRRSWGGQSDPFDDESLLRLQQIRIGRAHGLAFEEIRRWLARGAPGLPPPAARRAHLGPLPELEAKLQTREDQLAFEREASDLYAQLATRLRAGTPPGDPRHQAWLERHRLHIDRWFCPCEPSSHLACARALLATPALRAGLERHDDELPAYLLSVLEAAPD